MAVRIEGDEPDRLSAVAREIENATVTLHWTVGSTFPTLESRTDNEL